MKKSYLAIALTMSIFQINDVFSGKGDTLTTSYYQPYQELHRMDSYYHNNQPQGYYDNNQNYVTIYVDGTYSVHFMDTSVLATYYVNGAIQCNYYDGSVATYDALSGLSQYFTNNGYPSIVTPGLPGGIPIFYSNPHYNNYSKKPKIMQLKKSNKSYSNRDNKENFENNATGFQDQTINTNPIVQIDNVQQPQSDDTKSSKSIDEQILPETEQISSLKMPDDQGIEIAESSQKKTWSGLFKGLSNVVKILPLSDKKDNAFKKKSFNYVNLDSDAKYFLLEHNIQTSSELKNLISTIKNNNGSFTKNEFSCLIDAANVFRHSNNIENKFLAKNILKYILLNKRVDIYSKGRIYTYLGKIRSHDKKYEKAIKKFEEGLTCSDHKARLYYFIGNNFASLERYDEAIENWNKAFDLVSKEDISLKIKIHHRFLHCEEYHKNNPKIIDELLNKNLLLIENNYNIENFNQKDSKETKEIQRIYFLEIINITELYQNENLRKAAIRIRSMFNKHGFMTSTIKNELNYIKENISDLILEDILLEKPISDHIEMSE